MKIDIEKYEDAFILAMVGAGMKRSEAVKATSAIKEVVDTHLPCVSCGNVLPDDAFFQQAANANRRGRGTHCKACFRKVYPVR